MKALRIAKNTLIWIADVYFRVLKLKFPDYVKNRDRVLLMLHGTEKDVCRYMKNNLKTGMCVLDIGANVGIITRICARKVGSKGKVIAFEPDPHTREFLKHNTKLYSCVETSPIALSDENNIAKLHLHPGSGTSNSLINFDSTVETVDVECMQLDSFLATQPSLVPDIIKIDVEGAEPRVIRGMTETLSRFQETIVIMEFCPENLSNGGYDPAELIDLIESQDMDWHVITERGSLMPAMQFQELMNMATANTYCNIACIHKRRPSN